MIFMDDYTRDYINKLSDLNNIKESLDRYQQELEDTIKNYETMKNKAESIERADAIDFLDSELKTFYSIRIQVVSNLDDLVNEIEKVECDLEVAKLNRDLDNTMKSTESITNLTEKYNEIQRNLNSTMKSKNRN